MQKPVVRQTQPTAFSKVKALARAKPAQWALLKQFARTGQPQRGLATRSIREFAGHGFDWKEAKATKTGKHVSRRLSKEEKKEIKLQLTSLVELLFPEMSNTGKLALAEKLCKKIKLVKRADFEGNRGNQTFLFRVGRMYLDAIDEKNPVVARNRPIDKEALAFNNGTRIVLKKNWMQRADERTIPFHEALHELGIDNEEIAGTIEFYFLLKNGILTARQAKASKRTITNRGLGRAIQLFLLGKQQGWKASDSKLRKMIAGY